MEKISNLLIALGGSLAFGGLFVKNFFYTVDAGERAIIFDRLNGGLKEKVIGEGMHPFIPFVQVKI